MTAAAVAAMLMIESKLARSGVPLILRACDTVLMVPVCT
jgi:hypothetical protein